MPWQRIYYLTEPLKEVNRFPGGVIVCGLSPKYNDDPTIAPHPGHEIFESLPFFHIMHTELPPTFDSYLQLHTDDNATVKADLSWEVCLMPTSQIFGRHLRRLKTDIDDEIAKNSPDFKKIILAQREVEKCAKWTPQEWYEKAIVSLDDKVSKGEPDKSEIRTKLIHRTTNQLWK